MNADAGLDAIENRLDRLEAGQAELKAGQTELRAELKHEMHVLHEDVIDRIKALPTDVPRRAEMRRHSPSRMSGSRAASIRSKRPCDSSFGNGGGR